jgi:DNA-binding transcriptional LysR family regulator
MYDIQQMPAFDRADLPDLAALAAIVRRRSFKAASIELGISASALSHAMRRLEAKLGVKLLNRTSRSVAPTAAGMRFTEKLLEGFDQIASAVGDVTSQAGRNFGDLRLNVPHDAATLLLNPIIPEFTHLYPETRLTVVVENRPIDIVAEGFDAGIRYGDTVPIDMVAVPLTPPLDWIIVGAPAYIARYGFPLVPADLNRHKCIQLLLGDNSPFQWELGRGAKALRVVVPGTCTINDTQTTIEAAVNGVGLAYVLRRRVYEQLADGSLEQVLPRWASPGAGFQIYYPSRRHIQPALHQIINLIRHREGLNSI